MQAVPTGLPGQGYKIDRTAIRIRALPERKRATAPSPATVFRAGENARHTRAAGAILKADSALKGAAKAAIRRAVFKPAEPEAVRAVRAKGEAPEEDRALCRGRVSAALKLRFPKRKKRPQRKRLQKRKPSIRVKTAKKIWKISCSIRKKSKRQKRA